MVVCSVCIRFNNCCCLENVAFQLTNCTLLLIIYIYKNIVFKIKVSIYKDHVIFFKIMVKY